MRIGYACVNTRLPSASRTTRLANLTPERVRELTASNLDALEAILRWNAERGILVFRISSDTVPFGSHPRNTVRWWEDLGERLAAVGELALREGMRLSAHPGQYTVLGSPDRAHVESSVAELAYHARLLVALGLDGSHKIVLHMGGTYGDPAAAAGRFAATYAALPDDVRARLVVENDERWLLEDVLRAAEPLGVPVVFDNLHHEVRPSLPGLGLREAVLRAGETWGAGDGRQEVHFSTQAPGRRRGAHAESVDLAAFRSFHAQVGDLPLDCVLEVKDKEQSVLRAVPLLARLSAAGGGPSSRPAAARRR